METKELQRIGDKKFSTEGLPMSIRNKVKGIVDVLNEEKISIKKLKAFLAEGIPDEAAVVRQYCWKIILGFLPEERNKWDERVANQTKTYNQFINMFLPQQRFPEYPMQINKKHERWLQLETEFYLWEQIQKDTSRTHSELSFFCTAAKDMMIPFLTSPRKEKFRLIYGEDEGFYKNFLSDKHSQRKTYRYDYMTRILYIYARLNPKIQYVQGMNQILAPIFYLINSSKAVNDSVQEAACFFMFNNAISDVIELHIKDLDKSQNGIYGKLNQVNQMLAVLQPKVWNRLQKLKIDPFFYCFRWMTLLFAQDFPLFDILRIWESLFSAQSRLDFMNYFAISIIITSKDFIFNNDFIQVLEHLQNISDTIHLQACLKLAKELYLQFKDHDFKKQYKMTKEALTKPHKQKKTWGRSISSFLQKVNKMI